MINTNSVNKTAGKGTKLASGLNSFTELSPEIQNSAMSLKDAEPSHDPLEVTQFCRIKGCGPGGCPPPTNNFRKT